MKVRFSDLGSDGVDSSREEVVAFVSPVSLQSGGNILDSRELIFFLRSSVGMRDMLGPRTVLMGTGTIISESQEIRKHE